jgi:hypothetical protein
MNCDNDENICYHSAIIFPAGIILRVPIGGTSSLEVIIK